LREQVSAATVRHVHRSNTADRRVVFGFEVDLLDAGGIQGQDAGAANVEQSAVRLVDLSHIWTARFTVTPTAWTSPISSGGERPVHSALLGGGIPIVEHLSGLAQLPSGGFRCSAASAKVRGMGTFPVRACTAAPACAAVPRTAGR
jgi:hypothetical protein